MKKVKSAVFDSIVIPDLSLTLKKNEVVEIPERFFAESKDLKKAISKGHVMCEGMAHKGRIVKFPDTNITRAILPDEPEHSPDLVDARLGTLEKSVSILLKNYYETQHPKYDDYHLYMNTFATTNFDALVFDAFTDESKRHQDVPGDIVVRNGLLSNQNSEMFSTYNSQVFEVDGTITAIYPMARWHGDGVIQMSITVGNQQMIVLDTGTGLNSLWTSTGGLESNTVSITLALHSKYNNIYASSYGVLLQID